MRVLDLGCGNGLTPSKLSLPAEWCFIGADINRKAVAEAAHQFPARSFVVAAAEKLPFADGTFDRVIVNVALPYMNIPPALAEIRRVLIAEGKLWASLHDFRFMLSEFRRTFPKLVPTLFRFRVFFNGIVFHLTGRSLGESFQTKRGIALALSRESFSSPRLSHDEKRWIVEASSRCFGR
jgi:ubiquinone/menaquinone biosynthesis C-methylase UbiE